MSFAQKLLDGKVFGRALHGGQRVTRKTLNSLVGKEKVQNYDKMFFSSRKITNFIERAAKRSFASK